MDWCIGNSTLPLFCQLASHKNYYKLLYDYNVYDCVTEDYVRILAVSSKERRSLQVTKGNTGTD